MGGYHSFNRWILQEGTHDTSVLVSTQIISISLRSCRAGMVQMCVFTLLKR